MKSKDQKRKEEAIRLEDWRSLSKAEQLADLDRRLGKDRGAKRQHAKLVIVT